jgi:MazG family protein
MNSLINVMKKLRSPEGCPWDRKQTLESLTSCILEEAHESIDAILEDKGEKISEEIGDLLCIVSMVIAIGEERKMFTKNDVIQGAVKKMKHRHPHVFASGKARTATAAHDLWHVAKEQEPTVRLRQSVLDDLSSGLPSLHHADKIGRRVARVGFDWPTVEDAVHKIDEELCEVKAELKCAKHNEKRLMEELGDLLFATVNVARKLKINAEIALKKSNNKFIKRFQKLEKHVKSSGKNISEMTLQEMDHVWDCVKKSEKKRRR